MNTDSKNTETEQCTIPSFVCSCGGGNGAYHPIAENGNWTRPKSKESRNSLECDW